MPSHNHNHQQPSWYLISSVSITVCPQANDPTVACSISTLDDQQLWSISDMRWHQRFPALGTCPAMLTFFGTACAAKTRHASNLIHIFWHCLAWTCGVQDLSTHEGWWLSQLVSYHGPAPNPLSDTSRAAKQYLGRGWSVAESIYCGLIQKLPLRRDDFVIRIHYRW